MDVKRSHWDGKRASHAATTAAATRPLEMTNEYFMMISVESPSDAHELWELFDFVTGPVSLSLSLSSTKIRPNYTMLSSNKRIISNARFPPNFRFWFFLIFFMFLFYPSSVCVQSTSIVSHFLRALFTTFKQREIGLLTGLAFYVHHQHTCVSIRRIFATN